MRSFLYFSALQLLTPNITYSPGNMSQILPCNDITGASNLTSFTWNTVWDLFPMNIFHSQFTTISNPLLNLWGSMKGFSESLKLWVTLNEVCFPITNPHIYIWPKPWYPIMGMVPPHPIFPLITASETPENPSGASQSNYLFISQTNFTVTAAGISVHNIVKHNRDISLSKLPSIKWSQNQPNAASSYGTRFIWSTSSCFMTGL